MWSSYIAKQEKCFQKSLPMLAKNTEVPILLADLKACSRRHNLQRGKKVHAEAVECGQDFNIYVASALVTMYSKCGSMMDARQVFDGIKYPNVVSWNALILGYADNGQGLIALDMFWRMRSSDTAPDSVTFLAALKACTSLTLKEAHPLPECMERGKEVHDIAIQNRCNLDIKVQNTLIDMYAKCGSMDDAREVFNSINHPNVVSWNALIQGYADNGQGAVALELLTRMKNEGPALDPVTFVGALKACTSLSVSECRDWGKDIHSLAVENGCESDIYVQNTLIDMYAKCGCMVNAREVFDSIKHPDVVSWNVLILGYAENGQGLTALDLFTRMKRAGIRPESVTYLGALKACTSLVLKGASGTECRERGKDIHAQAVENGCDSELYVQNTLIDMYSKCGSMSDARKMFDTMKHPNVVSWTALILGYADNGQGLSALNLFARMKSEGHEPDSVAFLAALKACGMVGGLEIGRRIHSEIKRANLLDLVLVNGLVDFYAKCGSLDEAQRVFYSNPEARNVITWNALMLGFGICGNKESVFCLLRGMEDAGCQPDSVTFLCILTCCSHAGLVEKGKECFDAMQTRYGIVATIEHYTCMVDIFGRAKKLDDAMAVLQGMCCSPNFVTWKTVLAACFKWKNVEVGRLAFRALINLSHKEAAAYVLMGQIYGSKGMLHEQELVMEMSIRCDMVTA